LIFKKSFKDVYYVFLRENELKNRFLDNKNHPYSDWILNRHKMCRMLLLFFLRWGKRHHHPLIKEKNKQKSMHSGQLKFVCLTFFKGPDTLSHLGLRSIFFNYFLILSFNIKFLFIILLLFLILFFNI
jgi:hypothetical protein